MTYIRETPISREKALAILRACGRAQEYDDVGDYYLATTEDRAEYLTCYGYDEPLCCNYGTTSWL